MHVAIVGGSFAGLAAANVFHRLGWTVTVFEKFGSQFQNRGSSLGFVDVPLWEFIKGSPMIRRGKRASRQQGAYFYGDLWSFLFEGLPDGTVKFDSTVTNLGENINSPSIYGVNYDLVVVADGGWSSLRKYVNGDKLPEYAGHTIFRCKVLAEDYPEFTGDEVYTADKSFGIALNVALDNGKNYVMGGVAVGIPESDIVRPIEGASRHTEVPATPLPDWFVPFIRRKFRHDLSLVRWVEACAAKGKITPQPLFEFMADKVANGRILVIGDAAHMASPRTAAGAHTGILDALGLFEAFTECKNADMIDDSIRAYAPGGAKRARDLYLRSKEVSRPLVYSPSDGLPY